MSAIVTADLDTRRLNLGPGNHYALGWLNVDKYDLPHHDHRPDLMADVLDGLPLESRTFDQVYAGHVLEHIPYDKVPHVVAECWRLLRSGGRLAVVGPCIELAIRTKQPQWLLEQIVGEPTPENPGLGHEWAPTGLLTFEAVRDGLNRSPAIIADLRMVPVAEVAPPEWPNPCVDGWQCAILARKG